MRVSKSAHPRYSWRVTWSEGAKTRQRFFTGERAARDFAARKRPEVRDFARSDIEPRPEELRELARARAGAVPLGEAIDLWLRVVGAGRDMRVAELVEQRLQALGNVSQSHRSMTELKLGRLKSALGDMPIGAVRGADLRTLVCAGKSRADQLSTRAILSAAFAQAVADGMISANPVAGIKPTLKRPDTAIGIWNAAQVARWLQIVAEHAPGTLAGWAIGFYAGLRRSELRALPWAMVKCGHIEVSQGVSKTSSRRLVAMCPRLAALLAPLRKEAAMVWPRSPERAIKRCLRVLGEPAPINVWRHSYVSHHLALCQDIALTEVQAGHSRAVLFEHYRQVVTQSEALLYFGGAWDGGKTSL